jgi:hypothetical protein
VDQVHSRKVAASIAGVITPAAPITEETETNWDFTFAVDTNGIFFCLKK